MPGGAGAGAGALVPAASLLLVMQLAAQAAAQVPVMPPATPCPDVWQYARGADGVWRAQLWAWPPPRGQPIRLRIDLFLETALPTKYAGRVLLLEDKDVVAQKILAGTRERIKYMVLFPLMYPLPRVDRLTVNDDIMCMGPRVSSPVLTKISLEHTLYPSAIPLNSGTSAVPGNYIPESQPIRPDNDISWIDWPQPPAQPVRPPQNQQPNFQQPNRPDPPLEVPFRPNPNPVAPTDTRPPSPFRDPPVENSQSEQTTAEICGRPVAANELILFGLNTARKAWPWITAIFFSADVGNLEFQCSGTLINRKHVVTAGHCVKPRDQSEVEPNQLVVYLGMFNLRRVADSNSQPREVERIFVHPDFAATASFDADLAVLRLSVAADYNPFVKPICLWAGSQKLEAVVGMRGTVIGWGRDEQGNKATNEPRQTELPIVSQVDCLRSQSDFVTITSNRTFCAGFRNDTGPCNGDSGSGMFLRFSDGSATRWYLRGITSVSLYDRQLNRCDLRNYVVFTDMAKYGKWMQQFMKDEYL